MRLARYLGVAVAMLAVVSFAAVGCGGDDDDAELEEALENVLEGAAISADDFARVEVGMSREEAVGIVGEKVEEFVLDGAGDEPEGADCAYYLDEDDPATGYRVCYEGDSVVEAKEFTVVESTPAS